MSIDWNSLHNALVRQKQFSDIFFDLEKMSLQDKRELLKTFIISLHAETTGICESIKYQKHHLHDEDTNEIDIMKMMYESVDVYRYILAILNLFQIDSEKFTSALLQKDEFLHYRHQLSKNVMTVGQPVVLFDVDDVLAQFRIKFCQWSSELCGTFIDPDSDEYYCTRDFKRIGVNGDNVFKQFVDQHGFLSLGIDDTYLSLLNHLRSQGYWIQVVTSRPANNLTCFYDTYSWFSRNGIQIDGLAFTPEKFSWASSQKFYKSSQVFAVDDSSKHSAEYAKHGVKVLVPEKTYNRDIKDVSGIVYVPRAHNPIDYLSKI